MILSTFLSCLKVREAYGDLATEVRGLAYDSRRVRPGDLFVAIPGLLSDGHDYLREAWESGAVAVVDHRRPQVPEGRAGAWIEDARLALAQLADAFYGHPSGALNLIGVTGTNGKTTTTHLIRELLRAERRRVGLIGTVHNLIDEEAGPVEHTTPESLDLQALLRTMVDRGITDVTMEVSSHALVQERVWGLDFQVAVLTNLTQDHLDYHGTMDEYMAAKARLFTGLGRGGNERTFAVLNLDDPWYEAFAQRTTVRHLSYGLTAGADIQGHDLDLGSGGTRLGVTTPVGSGEFFLPLAGRFNVSNALAALAVGYGLGFGLEGMLSTLATTQGVPGRFERIESGQDFSVVIDYAHTPDGLLKVLETAREITPGRVILVFGCGGDRDRGKRPVMGEVAGRWADLSWVTSDNPRAESPAAILAEIETGFKLVPGAAYRLELDRRTAIRSAIRSARAGDLVLIAGKGHENYQIFRDRTVPFDDRLEATAALGEEVSR